MNGEGRRLTRRDFAKIAGTTTLGVSFTGFASFAAKGVAIVSDPGDPMAASPPVQWALNTLQASLTSNGIAVRRLERSGDAPREDLIVLAAGSGTAQAQQLLGQAAVRIPAVPESLGLIPVRSQVVLACGSDQRGLMYALLELADRVDYTQDRDQPLTALNLRAAVVEQPANPVRSNQRLFVSNVEDKPWYNDREMWHQYLTMLAADRFNRFNLSFGIGYDFLRNVEDAYFLFPYPFLVAVPGYDVRASGLPDAERDRNLEMLQFISGETVARGLDFQLGIWMHGYQWMNSPNPNYTIEGLPPEKHAEYCRDALTVLLRACPAISGVNFRVHGESGVDEGSYSFWETVFQGVVRSGREIEIDMHAKGMDDKMIEVALATGMAVKVSPKYWAEHLGMPYHQASIRELEMPRQPPPGETLMVLSHGSRRFLRYGYGDLLREDRRYGVLHRIWPGTQRLLLWGDPVTAAAYARAFTFGGSDGVEIMEPLSFKGRRGSGIAGDRCAYADASLRPRWDWEKYRYSYRIWGRLAYNPDTEPDVWRRYLRKQFHAAAPPAEEALAHASRILPIVTTAHAPSAGNNTYWPEIYTNQPIVDPDRSHPYNDTPSPRVFGNVSPLDPQLFSGVNDFADELLDGEHSGKYSPVEVAQWLEDLSATAARHLAEMDTQVPNRKDPAYRRLAIDLSLQIGVGRFFGAKLRSGVLYRIYERVGDRTALEEALKAYRHARSAWAEMADLAKNIYLSDITVGERTHLRGHWMDRLPAIDADIADMAEKLKTAVSSDSGSVPQGTIQRAIQYASGRPERTVAECNHTPPGAFRAGEPLRIEISVPREEPPLRVRLHYRRVNQVERYETTEMDARDSVYRAVIPGDYTRSPYPLQYYFELKRGPETAWLYPGFVAELTNQPYFVVRQA